MAEEKRSNRKNRILRTMIDQLPSGSFQKNPFFPNLLNQPDLLVTPAPGKLAAVFLYTQRLTWRSSLGSLEDLFETKLFLGRNTVTAAYDLSDDSELDSTYIEHDDMRLLLQNTFDVFVRLDFWKSGIAEERFWTTVRDATPRQNLFHLWDMEKGAVQGALQRFNRERYQPIIDRRHLPTRGKETVIRQIELAIEEIAGEPPKREPLVESIKGSLGSLSGRYKLDFDLITPAPIKIPIEIVRAGRHGFRDTVRYLMTKARLMSYHSVAGQLEKVGLNVRPLLIVEGNLAGPEHDPYRYVRSLVSVGWEVISADRINEIQRVLRDAYV